MWGRLLQATLSALKIARRAQQTLRRDLQDCFRSIPSLKNSIWGNRQELPRHVPSVTEKEGRCNVRFCSDTVAKVPKCRTTHFFANRPKKQQSLFGLPSGSLPRSPVSFSFSNVSLQIIIRSPHPRLGKFVFSDPKRVLQHYRSHNGLKSDIAPCPALCHNRK